MVNVSSIKLGREECLREDENVRALLERMGLRKWLRR